MTTERIRVDYLEFNDQSRCARLFILNTNLSKTLYGRQAKRILTQVLAYPGIYTIKL